jgi:glycosyltransferase involved in cell wall biosynthesis
MVSFYFHPEYSGSAIQALNLSRYLRQLGVVPSIVSANLSGQRSNDEVDGIRVHRLPVVRTGAVQVLSFLAALSAFLIRQRHEYDVIHAHGTVQHGAASICGRALGKPSILKVAMAGSDIAFHRQGTFWGTLNRFMVSRFDRYIATTQAIADEFVAQGLAAERVSHIPNGVDTDIHTPLSSASKMHLRAQLGLPPGPLVIFVGIMNARKNIDGILRIWNRAVKQGAPGSLILVGPHPSDPGAVKYHQKLRGYVASEGLDRRVVFAGHRSDVASLLQASDVFLFPSRQEGMPNSVLEAMACGLPPIVSRSAGVDDLVRDGFDGLTAPVDDESAFAACVSSLLLENGRREAIGAEARRTIVARYSLSAVAQRYAQLYAELLARPS